jgi:hypothetical protein
LILTPADLADEWSEEDVDVVDDDDDGDDGARGTDTPSLCPWPKAADNLVAAP